MCRLQEDRKFYLDLKFCKIVVIYVCKARLTVHAYNTSSIADAFHAVSMDTEGVLCMFY